MQDRIKQAFFWSLCSTLAFSIVSFLVKFLSGSYSSWEMGFFRSFVNLLILLPFVFFRMRPSEIFPLGRRVLVLRGLAGFGGLCCFFYAIANLPLSVGVILSSITPVFVILFSWIFLREVTRIFSIFAFLLIFAGVVFLVTHGESGDSPNAVRLFPVLIGLLGAIFGALAMTAVRRAVMTFGTVLIVLYFTGIASILLVPVLFVTGFTVPGPKDLGLLVLMGMAAAFAQETMTRAYREAPATLVSIMGLMGTGFSVLWGVFYFKESLHPVQWIGITLIVMGIVLVLVFGRPIKKTLLMNPASE